MLGINAKIYRNSATWGTPTWVECPEFENVSVDPRYTEAASNSRDSRFGRGVPTLAEVTITARLKVKPGNTNYEAFMDAFALGETVDLLILDAAQDVVGARGVRGECYLMAAGEDQGITARLYRDLEIKLADTDNLPSWARVATVGNTATLQFAVPAGDWA